MKLFSEVKKEFAKASKSTLIIYIVLRVLVIFVMVRQIVLGNYDNVILCLLTLMLFLLPYFFHKKLKIELPSFLQIVVLIFVFCAEILGEIGNYYINVPHFDTLLHTITGFFAASLGFALVDLLNTDAFKFKLSPFYLALVSFCFSMTVGVVWELFEYGFDVFLKTDMQKDMIVNQISSVTLNPERDNNAIVVDNIDKTVIYSHYNSDLIETTVEGGYLDIGLHDTMKDLLVNFIGAVIYSILGGLYVNNRDKYKFLERITPKKAIKSIN